MMVSSGSLNDLLLAHWTSLERRSTSAHAIQSIDGHNLSVATVVLVARYGTSVQISHETYRTINVGAKAFDVKSSSAATIYGVNTGFGGSADTRTKVVDRLKEDLLSGLQYGIVAAPTTDTANLKHDKNHQEGSLQTPILPLNHDIKTVMPESWVRASMLVRLNSLAHGASGVLPSTVEALLRLLTDNVIPKVPLHGSISASGDLSPLAYVAGVLDGKSSLDAYVDKREDGERHLDRADVALSRHSISPIVLTTREGLALVNGTSVSAAVAALAMHEALNLAALSQVLTAMSVEALRGTDESFDPFLASVRPHWGQAECSSNIHTMLEGSGLVNRYQGVTAARPYYPAKVSGWP